jgi:hypothetical protein
MKKTLEQNFESELRPRDLYGKYGKITILIKYSKLRTQKFGDLKGPSK